MAAELVWNVALCDDNPAFLAQVRQYLDHQLQGTPHRISAFSDPQALLKAAADRPFLLAVLDVQMPGQDGIAVARQLTALCPTCQIVFLTAYLSYAQDVYDAEHIAFVLKGEMEQRLPRVLERVRRRLEQQERPTLVVSQGGAATLVPQRQICWLERRVRLTRVHCDGFDLATPEKLEQLMQRLDPLLFCQCHKSYAICWRYTRQYAARAILLQNGVQVPVSRRFAAPVHSSFLRYTRSLQAEDGL